jgi:hypothetical protein
VKCKKAGPTAGQPVVAASPAPGLALGEVAVLCYNDFMENCRFHPDRDACVVCQKMEFGYCQECLDLCKACTDPCIYCKFRQGCVIWELCRKEAKKRCKEEEGEKAKGEIGEEG